ncbi:hypothetical protein RSAG8_05902, partial [Rhizoctonia solani AG-8 WAC10335]
MLFSRGLYLLTSSESTGSGYFVSEEPTYLLVQYSPRYLQYCDVPGFFHLAMLRRWCA